MLGSIRWSLRPMRVVTVVFGVLRACASFSSAATYDSTWTFVYDGGLAKAGEVIGDNFRDVKVLSGGDLLCVGETRDSAFLRSPLLMRLSADGKALSKISYRFIGGAGATSLLLAKSGDFVLGGYRWTAPFLMRLDPSLNVKSSTWHFDSTGDKQLLSQTATINSMFEAADGSVRAVAGDIFPDNNGLGLGNYAAYMEFDSDGKSKRTNQWRNTTGYEIAGWSIAPGEAGGILLGGKQAVFYMDTDGILVAKNQYGITVPGTGSQVNAVTRVRKLNGGALMVAGQSYEEDSWTRYGRLYYDAWWSVLNASGGPSVRNVAGVSGANDNLWDLVQLADGRIAFAGGKATALDSGMWVFVTDSSGRNILWQKQFDLPGMDQGSTRSNLLPLSMAATADSGFVVVGMESTKSANKNAFAFRFKARPDPVSTVDPPSHRLSRAKGGWNLSFEAEAGAVPELSLFDIGGRLEGRCQGSPMLDGRVSFRIDSARFGRGTRIWRFENRGRIHQGKLFL